MHLLKGKPCKSNGEFEYLNHFISQILYPEGENLRYNTTVAWWEFLTCHCIGIQDRV